MTEEKKKPINRQYSLEELNQQFISNINKKKKKKKKKKNKGVPGIWMLIFLIAVVLIVVLIIWKVMTGSQSAGENTVNSTTVKSTADNGEIFNDSNLSEEEQEKWSSTDLDEENIFVELNNKIYLDGSKAYIRLINPIYSVYYYSITIYLEGEEDTIFYQSEKVAPGTILEAVMLTSEPTAEQYSAIVKYQVYDGEGNELGSHPVHVEFTTAEQ